MLFNSVDFFIFFPAVVLLYFWIPHKYRWALLLVSSCYFYMAMIPVYILVLFFLILIDYFAGILIENSKDNGRKKLFLILSILANVGLLAFFKYFNFLSVNLNELSNFLGWNYSLTLLKMALPIGLSFHTFQSMSYTIEVYRGNQKTERHLGYYAVYVMFFPQLVAGPIERAKNLIPQFHQEHDFEYKRVTDGLKLMLWGFFKKIVIADRLAVLVNFVYSDPTLYTGTPLIIATVFFAFQIFCDFSGYTDIAIGAAQVMGFKLMDNFKRPYFSRSISEFWKRWHISLSTWFRDYLYFPLGGNRVSVPRWYFNLFFVFLVSGLWHGANWTFIIWGALHGFYLILGIITKSIREKILKITKLVNFPKLIHLMGVLFTFVLVDIGWIFFRANNVSDAMYVLTHLFQGINWNPGQFNVNSITLKGLIVAFGLIAFMELVHLMQEHISIRQFLDKRSLMLRWAVYLAITLAVIFLGKSGEQFIYFQF